tara:strand:+ start:657 stop:2129 length:1473 start_codon:yes stop_codon:yes gene_type:complete
MSETVQIPKGWKLKKLSDVCKKITSGGTPNRGNLEYFGGDIPWLKIGDLNDGEITNSKEKITKSGLENSSAKLFPKNTVLFAMYGATIGKTGILKNECATNQAICGMISGEKILPTFLLLLLQSKFYQIRKMAEGGAQPNINQNKLKNLEFLLPPISTQKKIVQKLDDILGQLEEKKKEILNMQQKLDKNFIEIPPSFANRMQAKSNFFLTLRNQILKNAFKGNLSKDQRKIQNYSISDFSQFVKKQREIVLSNLPKRNPKTSNDFEIIDNFENKLPKIPNEWIWTNIRSIETLVGSGVTPKGGKSNYIERGIPFIRSQNVLFNELDLSDVVFISEELHTKLSRTHVKTDDVLMNITGASIGRATSIKSNFKSGNVNQHVCIIRTGSWINPDYLSYWLNSPFIQRSIDLIESGGTKEGFNYEQIRNLVIPLPHRIEQDLIVNQIQKNFSTFQDLKNKIITHTQNLQLRQKQLSNLQSSILNAAFSGKLVQ